MEERATSASKHIILVGCFGSSFRNITGWPESNGQTLTLFAKHLHSGPERVQVLMESEPKLEFTHSFSIHTPLLCVNMQIVCSGVNTVHSDITDHRPR